MALARAESYFHGYDDIELFYQSWRPETTNGTLVITHGLSEHSDCYDRLSNGLEKFGWQIFGWDLRGHGRSEGKRGLVFSFDEFSQDFEIFLETISAKRFGPLILLGHSMGGLVVSRTLLKKPELASSFKIDGVVLSAPAMGITMPVPWIKDKASHVLSRFFPRLTLDNEVDYLKLSSDPDILVSYERDALRHDKISPRLYLGMVEGFEFVSQQASTWQLPLLMQVPQNDPVVSTPASKVFYDKIQIERKNRIVYEKSLHEVYNDVEREQGYADLGNFLNSFTGGNP